MFPVIKVWCKNITGRFFGLVTQHAWQTEGQTDGQNYDSQDRASIAASCGNNNHLGTVSLLFMCVSVQWKRIHGILFILKSYNNTDTTNQNAYIKTKYRLI